MLIIDNREGKLIELIKSTPSFTIPYELKSLQIGDIIISNDKYPDKSIIIERKCVPDMLASIKDGRYKEQKVRLQAEKCNSNGNKLICYLIEGSSQDVRYPQEKKVFHGSLVSSIFRDEIPLIRTISLIETLEIINRIHDRMEKDMNDFFKPIIISNTNESNTNVPNNIPNNEMQSEISIEEITIQTGGNDANTTNVANATNSSYLNSIKKCKKENLTPKLWNQISLTNIPGVSTNIATKISEIYPSLKKLFQEYDKCETDESRIKIISEIILTDNGKTKRRIGEVVSKRILEYLYN
jgi:crossover junction endonuclease MUS81